MLVARFKELNPYQATQWQRARVLHLDCDQFPKTKPCTAGVNLQLNGTPNEGGDERVLKAIETVVHVGKSRVVHRIDVGMSKVKKLRKRQIERCSWMICGRDLKLDGRMNESDK